MSKFRAWLARKIYKSSVTIYSLHPLDAHVDGTELIVEAKAMPFPNTSKQRANLREDK
jgi:hypothetical protein